MLTFSTIDLEIDAGVVTVTLDRPDANNSINAEMAHDLMRVAVACDESRDVRAILLRGKGKSFCPGGDLKSFNAQADGLPAHVKEVTAYLHAAVSRFARGDAPIVSAVAGAAAGAGLSLALMGDVVIASRTARLCAAYTAVGLCPDGALTYNLPRIVGEKRARELILTNRVLGAAEALEWGLVNRVVETESLETESRALAVQLAEGATAAFGASRRLLADSFSSTLETQMEMESRSLADMTRTVDARGAIEAFIAKRKPSFNGE